MSAVNMTLPAFAAEHQHPMSISGTDKQRNKQMLDCFTGPVPDGGGVGEASDEALQPRSS